MFLSQNRGSNCPIASFNSNVSMLSQGFEVEAVKYLTCYNENSGVRQECVAEPGQLSGRLRRRSLACRCAARTRQHLLPQ